MMLVQFDTNRLGDDIAKLIGKRGDLTEVARATGVPYSTLWRLVNGRGNVKNIDAVVSVVTYFKLSIKDYAIYG